MKLKRSFIDVKRLASIGLNSLIRTNWLVDYVKSIAKPMEYINNQQVSLHNELSEYVLFNGQKLSLKTYIDDNYDIVGRRTVITENKVSAYLFTGYYDYNIGTWYKEPDPVTTTFNGYCSNFTGNTYNFILEEDLDNQPMYGYVLFNIGDYLIDVENEAILDSYEDFIYTSSDSNDSNNYIFKLESSGDEGLIFYLHSDIYNNMTDIDKETLVSKLERYVIAPITYRLDEL